MAREASPTRLSALFCTILYDFRIRSNFCRRVHEQNQTTFVHCMSVCINSLYAGNRLRTWPDSLASSKWVFQLHTVSSTRYAIKYFLFPPDPVESGCGFVPTALAQFSYYNETFTSVNNCDRRTIKLSGRSLWYVMWRYAARRQVCKWVWFSEGSATANSQSCLLFRGGVHAQHLNYSTLDQHD